MSALTITCESCDRQWAVANVYSVYGRQAVESCPCPGCWAYTLRCPAEVPAAYQPNRVWRPRPVAVAR